MIWWKKFPSSGRTARRRSLALALVGAGLVAGPALAQDTGQDDPHAKDTTPGMNMVDMNPASMVLMNLASGTSVNAAAWPMPMAMTHFGSWNTMFMGTGFIVDTQQSGPRGGDKLYSPNW